jgi:predicted dehydrogenase
VTYRVDAGGLDPSHWYHDRRQGGRLLGEACHFIDKCAAILGQNATRVEGLRSGRGESLLDEDFIFVLGYPDGSLASVTYASGGSQAAGKEHIEVVGGASTARLDDFRVIGMDRRSRTIRGDKGHRAAVVEFRRRILEGGADDSAIASTRTALRVVERLSAMG